MKFKLPIPFSFYRNDYDQDKMLGLIREYKEHIHSLYMPIGYITKDISFFGPRSSVVGGKLTLEQIEAAHAILFQEFPDLKFSVLLNDIVTTDAHANLPALKAKLQAYASRCQLHSITVSDIALAIELAPFPVCLSVNTLPDLEAINHALLYKGRANIAQIVIPRQHNRSPAELQSLAAHLGDSNIELVLMLNEGCVLRCPFKTPGDINITADNNQEQQGNIHYNGCNLIRTTMPWAFMAAPFLTYSMLQQDPVYNSFIGKIAGRNLSASIIRGVLEHYLTGKSISIADLNNVHQLPQVSTDMLSREYNNRVFTCDKRCYACNYCAEYLAKVTTNVK